MGSEALVALDSARPSDAARNFVGAVGVASLFFDPIAGVLRIVRGGEQSEHEHVGKHGRFRIRRQACGALPQWLPISSPQ